MSWVSIQATIRCRNIDSPTAPYRDVVIDMLALPPLWVKEDSGEREPGSDGTRFQNRVRRLKMPGTVRRFRIDQGEWDHGDYELMWMYLSAAFLELVAVTDSALVQTATDTDGTDHPMWSGDLKRLPRRVVVEMPEAEVTVGDTRWLNQPITIWDERPTIGCVIE